MLVLKTGAPKSVHSYLAARLEENGITEQETRFPLPSNFISNYFSSDQFGNIEIFYSNLDGAPLIAKKKYSEDAKFSHDTDYVKRIRYSHPLPNAPKYLGQKGMPAKLPYLNGIITYCPRWNDIETLVITEGEFKALRACKSGIPTVGIQGIGNFATAYDRLHRTRGQCEKQGIKFHPATASLDDLWHDLLKELPNLKNVVFLHDADALDGNYKRKKNFFSSIKNFHLALKNKPYSLFYAHGLKSDFKGIDDLLNAKEYSIPKIKDSLLSLSGNEFFKVFPINTHSDKHRILKHFFPNYKSPITCEELTVNVFKYLSECKAQVFKVFDKEKRVLLDAPTGTGKTFSIFDYANVSGKRLLFAVPTRPLVDQIAKEYNAYAVKGGLPSEEMKAVLETAKEKKVVVSTYDQVKRLIDGFDCVNDLLVIDESHNLVNHDFRKLNACEPVFQAAAMFEHCIIISGTPNPFFECLPNPFKRLRVNRSEKKDISLKPVFLETRKERLQYVLDQLTINREGPLQAVRLNNRDQLDILEKMLIRNGFKPHEISKIYNRSELETDSNYLDIINKGALHPDVKILLSTCKINEGINLSNQIRKIYIIDEICPDAIIQFIGRFRKAETLEVYFLCKEKTTGNRETYQDIFGQLVGYSMAMQKEFEAIRERETISHRLGLDLSICLDRPHGATVRNDGSIDWLGLLIEAKKRRDQGLTTNQLFKLINEYGITVCNPVILELEPTQGLTDIIAAQKENKELVKEFCHILLRDQPDELIGAVMTRTKSKSLKNECAAYLGSSLTTTGAQLILSEHGDFISEWERVIHKKVREFLTLHKHFPDGDKAAFVDFMQSVNTPKLIRQIENAVLLHKYEHHRSELTPAQRKDARLMITDIEEVQAMDGSTLKQLTERLNSTRKYAYLRRTGKQYRERLNGLFLRVTTSKNDRRETVISGKIPIDFEQFSTMFSAKKSRAEKTLQVVDIE